MRQVREDELIHLIQSTIGAAPRSVVNKLTHFDAATSLTARLTIVAAIVAKMKRIEMLVDAPEPTGFKYPDFDVRLLR